MARLVTKGCQHALVASHLVSMAAEVKQANQVVILAMKGYQHSLVAAYLVSMAAEKKQATVHYREYGCC